MNTLRTALLFVFALATLYAHGQQDKKQHPPEDSIRAAFLKHPEFQPKGADTLLLKFSAERVNQIKKQLAEPSDYLPVDTFYQTFRPYDLFEHLAIGKGIKIALTYYPVYFNAAEKTGPKSEINLNEKKRQDRLKKTLEYAKTEKVFEDNFGHKCKYELIKDVPKTFSSMFPELNVYNFYTYGYLPTKHSIYIIEKDGTKKSAMDFNKLYSKFNKPNDFSVSDKIINLIGLTENNLEYCKSVVITEKTINADGETNLKVESDDFPETYYRIYTKNDKFTKIECYHQTNVKRYGYELLKF